MDNWPGTLIDSPCMDAPGSTIAFLKNRLEQDRRVSLPPDWKYRGPIDYILRNGKEYDNAKKNEDEPGEPQKCFDNAREYARKYGFEYCEGYASSLDHAWCVDG